MASNPFAGIMMIWRDRPLRMLALTGGAYCWGQFVVISYTVVAAVAELGMSLIVAGTLLTAVHLGSVAGSVVAGWLADRAGGTRVLIWIGWLLLAAAALAFWMGPAWPPLLLYVLFALLGVATGAWAGLLLAESVAARPARTDRCRDERRHDLRERGEIPRPGRVREHLRAHTQLRPVALPRWSCRRSSGSTAWRASTMPRVRSKTRKLPI